MKLSDYVAQKAVENGVKHVFMVTGGGAMHLNHSFGTHKDLECIFNHHEQACAIGAEAYYRQSNRLPIVNVTSGPGGTNTITGVYGAWVDSIAMLVISGQVKWETTVRSTGLSLRQYGDQELDIEELVRPVTKYCVMVTDPLSIRYHLEKAMYLATSGRPGPVWLDIPLNVQASQIDPDQLTGFDPAELSEPWKDTDLNKVSKEILKKIAQAKRPIVFAGGGVRLSGQHQAFIQLVEKLGVPVVTGWNAHDVIWNAHPNYVGRPGSIGDRAGNFAVQNADLLLILGSRLNIRQVSYNWKSFAREAYKIWVDIDVLELQKPTVKAEMPVLASLTDLLPILLRTPYKGVTSEQIAWLAWCKERQRRFPTVLPEYWNNERINTYCFISSLFDQLKEGQNIVTGNGSACVVSFQAAILKPGQRLWTNSGCATMGYDLPAAIGVTKALDGEPVVCLAGDGSIMMNLQELQTIVGNHLPIKIFILNNSGYVSIFQTHRNFFGGVEVGGGPKSGVSFPSFEHLSTGFGIPYLKCASHAELNEKIAQTLATKGPVICELIIDENQPFAPKLSAKQHPDGRITSPALEDLSPFLSREELLENMIIDLMEDE
ncbi:MAG: thiamine pyrophosphate-binding protein [Candidatus Marinimicrobia bacterium]|jgi:acetolactate synthase I/II/III large subunit|nr:thiamine pyrophosphate-binding protein [Gammaproteobacteria bacterium]MBT5956123.1 thiamine pyrophosphate-binding protein [Candidatus Neomarinimicrobiota bacterium]